MKKLLRFIPLTLLLAFAAPAQAVTPFFNAAVTATPVLVSSAAVQAPTLLLYNGSNANTGLVFIEFFNAATAGSVTLGTTVPVMVLGIPANNGVIDNSLVKGLTFSAGLVIAVVTVPLGSTAPSSAIPITLLYE